MFPVGGLVAHFVVALLVGLQDGVAIFVLESDVTKVSVFFDGDLCNFTVSICATHFDRSHTCPEGNAE